MKSSKYNIYLIYEGQYYVFNQLSSDFRELDHELYEVLKQNKIDEAEVCADELSELKSGQIVCEDHVAEENLILCANKRFRFSQGTARVTIMPTLECNFRCWYCYETHNEGHMSEKDMEATIAFCKKLIDSGHVHRFVLDWFGGEPLLYFDKIVYPISLAVRDYCKEKNIIFQNTITTNGFLISENIIDKLAEIRLNSYQITLDGSKQYHDRTRFSSDRSGSYDRIVGNIIMLCNRVQEVSITLRINYTPANLSSIDCIADSFPEQVRKNIFVEPQLVWQYKDEVNSITDSIQSKMRSFHDLGYRTRGNSLPAFVGWCYAESMDQYVINYNLKVYKCTARDFTQDKFSVGVISSEGNFKPNSNFYRYFTSSFFENDKCLSCEVLPSCAGMCIQKKIEGSIPGCPKQLIMESIRNRLIAYINSQNESNENQ